MDSSVKNVINELSNLTLKSDYSIDDTTSNYIRSSSRKNTRENISQVTIHSLERTSALEQIFEYQDKTEDFLKDNHPDKAYASMRRIIGMGRDLIYSKELVRFYKCALLSKHSEKAARIRDELFQILMENTEVTAVDIELYARRLDAKEKSIEAVLFFQIACGYYQKKCDGVKGVEGMTVCCEGIRNACKNLLARESSLKSLILYHVVPIMHDIRFKIKESSEDFVEKGFVTSCEVKCLHCVEYTEGRCGDYASRELTLREGINLMEGKLGDGCRKWRVYSLLLNNLGCTYEIMGRLEESCLSYAKAVVSYKSAEDYQSDDQRMSDISSSERGLKRIKEKIKQSAAIKKTYKTVTE